MSLCFLGENTSKYYFENNESQGMIIYLRDHYWENLVWKAGYCSGTTDIGINLL